MPFAEFNSFVIPPPFISSCESKKRTPVVGAETLSIIGNIHNPLWANWLHLFANEQEVPRRH